MASLFSNVQSDDLSKYLENAQTKSYLVAASTVLFIVVFVVFGIVPAYRAVFDQIEANRERDEAIEKLETKLSVLQGFDNQYENKREFIEYLNTIFPTFADSHDEYVNRIFDIVESNNASLLSIGIQDPFTEGEEVDIPNVDGRVYNTTISLTTRGDRTNLIEILRDLEDSRFIFNIINSSVNKLAEDELETTQFDGDHELIATLQLFFWEEIDEE